MHDKTSQLPPLGKRFRWFFRKHFGNANTVRTSLSITLLSGFGIILLIAAGGPLLSLVILGTVAAVAALVTLVSGLKSFFDYVAERQNEVTDETIIESLQSKLYEWVKEHWIASMVGALLLIGTLVLIFVVVISPASLIALPFLSIALNFVAAGFIGVSTPVALPLAALLIGVAAVIVWDGLCRIANAIFFPEDHARMISAYRLRAQDGDPEAQFKLGLYNEKVQGESIYSPLVRFNYTLAANQGHTQAKLRVAELYLENKEDNYKQAADEGDREAQFKLAEFYSGKCYFLWGETREPNEKEKESAKKAMHYYQLAANQGHARAKGAVGYFYSEGIGGVEKDLVKAFAYYQESAKLGNEDAEFHIAFSYYNGDGVEKNLEKAVHYYEILAQRGHTKAQYNLGYCYYKGEGVEQDREKALEWFTVYGKAQEDCNVAYTPLGRLFGQYPSLAFEYYRPLVEKGFAVPQYHLGLLYYKGEGVNQNRETAVSLFCSALEGHVFYVKSELRELYLKDRELEGDILAQQKINRGQAVTYEEESGEFSQETTDDEEESGEKNSKRSGNFWQTNQSKKVDGNELSEQSQDTDEEKSGDENDSEEGKSTQLMNQQKQ